MKFGRWMAGLCAGAMMLSATPVNAVQVLTAVAEDTAATSGELSKDIVWNLDESTGTLTISGKGGWMKGPWYSDAALRDKIKTIIIEEGITSISYREFYCCHNLKTVELPDSLKGISSCAFQDCDALTSITFKGVERIYSLAFQGCKSLTSITLPEGLTTLQESCFSGCESLKTIVIPESVKEIGRSVFDGTLWLEEQRKESPLVVVNGILIDGKTCEGDVVIPDGVTEIANEAFCFNHSITTVTIPDCATYIGERAFAYSDLTDITVPESVTDIGKDAFYSTKWLNNKQKEYPVVVVNGIVVDGKSCEGDIIIPDGVTKIGDGAFDGSSSSDKSRFMTSVYIPDTVTEIGEKAFTCCDSLTNVIIPESVTKIGSYAFQNCYRLESVAILNSECMLPMGNSDDTISNGRDENYTSYFNGTIYGYEGSTAQGRFSGIYHFEVIDGDPPKATTVATTETTTATSKVTATTSTTTKQTTTAEATTTKSASTTKKSTTTATQSASKTDTTKSSTTHTTTTTTTKPTEETVPTSGECGENVKWKFDEDTGTLTIKGEGEIVDYPWNADKALSESIDQIVIEDGILYIPPYVFEKKPKLKSVVIPKTVEKIGSGAFYKCVNLTEVIIPESVVSVEGLAFSECSALKSVTFYNPDCQIENGAINNAMNNYVNQYSGAICGYEGSTAQKYAEKYSCKFESLGEAPKQPTEKPTDQSAISLGDLDDSGVIDIMDVIKVNKFLLGSEKFTDAQRAAADVDGSGEVDPTDSLIILKYVVELIDSFDAI